MRYIVMAIFFISLFSFASEQDLTSISQLPAGKQTFSMTDYEELVIYYRYYKPDSAIYFAQQGLTFAQQSSDTNGVAAMLIQQGMIDDNGGKFDESEKKYQQALALYSGTHSKKGIATATIRLGVVQLRNGKYDKAIEHFLQALTTAEESGNTFGRMEAYYSISWAYLDQQLYPQALEYLLLAEQLNSRLPFSNISLNIYNHFGVVYRQLHEYSKAKYYLEKGIQLSDKLQYQGLHITLINNLASVYAEEGFKEKAVVLQKKALAKAREIDNYLRELQTLYGLARTYGNDNPSKAIFYLEQAIHLAKEKKAFKQEMRYLKAITEFHKKEGNYKQALSMKEREHTLADSIFYQSMALRIDSLKSAYELSKSQAKIKELSYINSRNGMELEKAGMIKKVTFAGIALLLIILGLLYNRYWLKKCSNAEISHRNQSLQQLLTEKEGLLAEKEWLLKEIHHRVKNNLHMVTSLLESQSAYLEDNALTAIRDSQHRVFAMSLIHQKLYQSEKVASIDMSVYLQELVQYLQDSFDTRQKVRFQLQLEPVELDVSQAVPVGLILNEAITNAVKYAFPHHLTGIIAISSIRLPDDQLLLTIADNGIGLPTDFDLQKINSLGMKLMRGLSEDLGALFRIENNEGTKIELAFPIYRVLQDLRIVTTANNTEYQL